MTETHINPISNQKPNHSSVTLRIFGDALDPDEITTLLKCPPSRSHRKGDLITNRDGLPYWNEHSGRHSVRKTGMWSLKAPLSEPADIESQMLALFAELPDNVESWNKISQTLGLAIEFYCGFFMRGSNEGFGLSASILSEMAKRHVKLEFDIYSPSDEELREQG